MRELYFDCGMGASGDMIMAALLDLADDKDGFLATVNGLMEGVEITVGTTKKRGIRAACVSVKIDGREEGGEAGHHSHRHLAGVESVIGGMRIQEAVKKDALSVYKIIAEAEGEAHGQPVNMIHFHELGETDAIIDIVGACLLIHGIAPDNISASAVNVGGGTVKCAHGVMPVPAPATAIILKGVPAYGGGDIGELCTPTGAAIIKHFVSRFGGMPPIVTRKIGVGAGKKDFDRANILRAFTGESFESKTSANGRICELCCETDDMTGEHTAFACERLLAAGAADVFVTPVYMKKNRPGVLLTVLCAEGDCDKFAALMLKHTTTFGVRYCVKERYELNRRFEKAETPYGTVNVKAGDGFGVNKSKIEFDDAAVLAVENGIDITGIREENGGIAL